MGMRFQAWVGVGVFSFGLVACRTYKRPKHPELTLYQGYYNAMSPNLVPEDATPEVSGWTNIIHVDAAGWEASGRRAELVERLAVYAGQGKKIIVDLGGFFFNVLQANVPVTSAIPLLMAWHEALWPLRDSIQAIQVLDEPRNWMDRAPYLRTLSGEDISRADAFSQSRYFQRDVSSIARSFFADFRKPLSAHFDNVSDVGSDFEVVAVNLYARRGKIERMMNEFYWKAHDQGQKLWVTGRAFSSRGIDGSCNFHCRPQEVLLGDAEETERVIRVYGAEVVLWFIYQNFGGPTEVATGSRDNPQLLERHRSFFQDFILQNWLRVSSAGAAATEAPGGRDRGESIYVMRTSSSDPGRVVDSEMGKAFLDQTDVEIVPRPATRVKFAASWKR